MESLAELDHRYLWHPFTQMRDWLKTEPIVLVRGRGAELMDDRGRKYLDANSSIWTNLHGHNHPRINRAIVQQLGKIAHSSALGFANEPASQLGKALILAASPTASSAAAADTKKNPRTALSKVFFSDDGSTAMEVALKLAFETARRSGRARKPRFLSLQNAYHGDTVGAVSLGHIDLFHKAYSPLLFKSDKVMAPYCYRCTFNRTKPERADARQYRKCNWECLAQLEQKCAIKRRGGEPYAGFVFEPSMQGAAGMIPQPKGWLQRACGIARENGALLIADEVMTGFGRTGSAQTQSTFAESNDVPGSSPPLRPSTRMSRVPVRSPLFACHHEDVQPDLMALAKGLTGGYLPMAATLSSQAVFDSFLGEYEDFKTFFHGHSFTGNQLGAASALASLEMLQEPASTTARVQLENALTQQLGQLWQHPQVGDIRQAGLIAGIELVEDWKTRKPFDLRQRAGMRVCEAMARRGVLTRPVGNVVVLMPPYCTTEKQVKRMVAVLGESIAETLQGKSP
ncbi:MAG TPA: aminotransferase class III-fold pyridoxal phosphate-dependent enzyme [Verrucomicrobiae bacterium]|nr:aminotransferase class III-fold pyridoxal phosphate-dependent enzyme [Verrucomicrobiae bacterium]